MFDYIDVYVNDCSHYYTYINQYSPGQRAHRGHIVDPCLITLMFTSTTAHILTPVLLRTYQISELIVDTVQTEQQLFFLQRFVALNKPLLFIGPTSTGKSAITNSYLLSLPRNQYVICNINFSAQTTSNQTQDIIYSKVDRFVASMRIGLLCFLLTKCMINVSGAFYDNNNHAR